MIVRKEQENNFTSHQLILDLSKALTKQLGKGFSRSSLFNMRLFYLNYKTVQTLPEQLSWSRICELLTLKDTNKLSR